MFKIKFSPDAHQDIHEIQDYITNEYGSVELARKTTEKIAKRIRQLELFPESGAPLSAIIRWATDFRYLVCDQYMIFYTIEGKRVQIERIIYGRRNYYSILFKQ